MENKLNNCNSWVDAVAELTAAGVDYIVVTIIGARGSSPRDSGTKMVVSREHSYATIGGGHLEYKAIAMARELIRGSNQSQHIEHFPLGSSLGQCCGGSVSLLFEKFVAAKMNIMVFGAGHVGQALCKILADLPCRLTWVDSREDMLANMSITSGAVKSIISDEPEIEVTHMPANSYFVIMTHNHQQDFEIIKQVLLRKDADYVGLIGSKTKWSRFRTRLEQRSLATELQIDGVHCPIGVASVVGKAPMEVAVSIAAELIQTYSAALPAKPMQQGDAWRDLKSLAAQLLVGGDK